MGKQKSSRSTGTSSHRSPDASVTHGRTRRPRHRRNALSTHLWSNLLQAFIFMAVLTTALAVFSALGLAEDRVIMGELEPAPEEAPSADPMQQLVDDLVAKYDCTYGSLPNNQIPAHSIIRNEAGVPVLATLDEGLAFLGTKESERLIAVCAK